MAKIRVPNLVVIYIWNVQSRPRFFVLSTREAIELVRNKCKKMTSWTTSKNPGWSWPITRIAIADRLQLYENRWEWLRKRLEASRVVTKTERIHANYRNARANH